MAWQKWNGIKRYYTRKRTVEGKVVVEYVGCGPKGQQAAAEDAQRRLEEKARSRAVHDEKARLKALEAPLLELSPMVDLMTHATLVAAGYYQHDRGEWRRRIRWRQR